MATFSDVYFEITKDPMDLTPVWYSKLSTCLSIWSTAPTKKRRNNTFALIVNLFGLVVFFYVNSLYGLQSSFSNRHTFIGVACNIVTPIIDVILAIFLQDVPAWLSLTGIVNAGIWICYALIGKVDIYILISNVLGFWLCVIEFSSRNAPAPAPEPSTTPTVNVVAV